MENTDNKEILKINFSSKHKHARAVLRVVNFKDGDFEIAYIPSLNLSGYGVTEDEAMRMLNEVVVKDYLFSLIALPEAKILAELREYGWQRRPYLPKQLQNTQFLSIEKIKENFNLPAETQFHEQFVTA